MGKARDLITIKASKDLSASCIILYSMSTFIVNL